MNAGETLRWQPPLADALCCAATVVARVIEGANLDRALRAQTLGGHPAVRALSAQTLRAYGRGDFLLSCLLKKTPPLPVRALLLVALQRLEERADQPHTLVDQAVRAARAQWGERYCALINAVLRRAVRQTASLQQTLQADDVAHWCHPAWWLSGLRAAWPADWMSIAQMGNRCPPMTLRINRARWTLQDCQTAFAREGIIARERDETAIVLDHPRAVSQLPGFTEGCLSVQDWGAQQATPILLTALTQAFTSRQDPLASAPWRILDACAAPGGKTGHILEWAAVQGQAIDVLALDQDPARVAMIDSNLDRLHFSGTARVALADAVQWAQRGNEPPFQAILLDAPCTASGVVGRHPDAKWLRRPSDIARFVRQQRRLLDALWPCLAPGGFLLYSTCSVFPAENQEQMDRFAAQTPAVVRCPTAPTGALDWQLLPCADHDGFYYALLRRAPPH
jgi:16S rRNA (cytosine967-C5)-methyltransferase